MVQGGGREHGGGTLSFLSMQGEEVKKLEGRAPLELSVESHGGSQEFVVNPQKGTI